MLKKAITIMTIFICIFEFFMPNCVLASEATFNEIQKGQIEGKSLEINDNSSSSSFDHVMWLAGSQFPNQRLNPGPWQ